MMNTRYPALLHSGILGEILRDYRTCLVEKGFEPLNERIFLPGDELQNLAPRAEVIFGPGPGMDAAFFEVAVNLKVVSLVSSGWDAVNVEAATQRGIPVTIAPAPMAESVADLVWGLIISLFRNIPQRFWLLKTEKAADTSLGRLVNGKTLGIVGMGYIGKAVARRAVGFDMRLLGFDFDGFWDKAFATRHNVLRTDLNDLLQTCDIVSLHLRPSPKTIGIIGPGELAIMKPGAILINTSRANLVDTQALYQALESGHLGGLGTDVDTDYGLDTPLLSLPNVICTPHIGGRSLETAYELVDQAIANALAVLSGQQPLHLANPEVYSIISTGSRKDLK